MAAAPVPYCSALSGLLVAPRFRPPLEGSQQENVGGEKVLYLQGKENHTQNDRSPVEGPATTHSIQGQGSDTSPENTAGHAQSREPVGLQIVKASSAIDVARVDDNCCDTRAILHEDLEPER